MCDTGRELQAVLDEAHFLEAELRDLGRRCLVSGERVSSLGALVDRNRAGSETARRELLQAETDVREWEARDASLASSIQSSSQSSKLLAGLGVQAKGRLEQERKVTRDQVATYQAKVKDFRSQVARSEEKALEVPACRRFKDLEVGLGLKRKVLEELQERWRDPNR